MEPKTGKGPRRRGMEEIKRFLQVRYFKDFLLCFQVVSVAK
jgi:hypothetical protein